MKILEVGIGELPSYRGVSQSGKDMKVLSNDFYFATTVERQWKEYTFAFRLEAGYAFDGASIPRWLWWLCGHPFQSPRDAAALIHDWCYESKFFSRSEADAIYRAALDALGFQKVRGLAETWVLRLFGWLAWNAVTDEETVSARNRIDATVENWKVDLVYNLDPPIVDVSAADAIEDYEFCSASDAQVNEQLAVERSEMLEKGHAV